MDPSQGFMTIRSRRPHDANSINSGDSTYFTADSCVPATHDISRVSYHVKHLDNFVQTLQESASRAFPNRGRPSQRYSKVQALLLHWKSDDLFVLPELEDLEKTLREDYSFDTDIFSIPSENSHLELMLKIGDLIKRHESEDTLFLVYYGGHARIDESRQSTWCATRHPSSPWLQWSAIQTLLERSMADVLILLDCCAGAASATFPNGQSITETISASSWDAIAPDPGRYSFTNALIEVLQEWRNRTFSAAMLHAEILARLKHPRPILINGKHFEARSTPVHFMMTSNHKAPSIEFARIVPESRRPPSPPKELPYRQQVPGLPDSRSAMSPTQAQFGGGLAVQDFGARPDVITPENSIPDVTEPNEDQPHVMISLALEEDQRLDVNAWEQWLASFPALAKYVKVQGMFKSHSTMLLLSLPVMVWDLLPNDPACSFVAFIRSNNLMTQRNGAAQAISMPVEAGNPMVTELPRADDAESFFSGTTFALGEDGMSLTRPTVIRTQSSTPLQPMNDRRSPSRPGTGVDFNRPTVPPPVRNIPPRSLAPTSMQSSSMRSVPSAVSLTSLARQNSNTPNLPNVVDESEPKLSEAITRTMILNQSRSTKTTTFVRDQDIPEGPALAKHVVNRLEEYFQKEPQPTLAIAEFLASNLGVETSDIHLWFHHRRQQERMKYHLQNLRLDDHPPEPISKDKARMILPGDLNNLLEIFQMSRSVMLIDMRSSTDFEKSHIHGAINLRAPLSFIQNMTLESIQDTFVDDQSRRTFNKWFQSRCIVFYDRAVEFSWECPVADALYERFRSKGWVGQGFILKGHYREFSDSFDKYISGTKMTSAAKKYLDSLREASTPSTHDLQERNMRYDQWLRTFELQDRSPMIEFDEARRLERQKAVDQHQKELEAEFETRFPSLHKKSQALKPAPFARAATSPGEKSWTTKDQLLTPGRSPGGTMFTDPFKAKAHGKEAMADDFDDAKAQLVGPLSTGLEKMREAAAGGGYEGGYGARALGETTYTDKLGETAQRYSDDYDEIDIKGEGLKYDPAFQQAGSATNSPDSPSGVNSSSNPMEDPVRKARKKGLLDRLRGGGAR